MSVTEKLKVLRAAANGPQTYSPEPLEEQEAVTCLLAALPQIVAVVEAAEDFPEIFVVEGRSHSFVPLLDALDGALTVT